MASDIDNSEIVRVLAAYLRRNPEACDTHEGIARWWFENGTAPSADHLLAALVWLVEYGVLAESRAADGRLRYRRASRDASVDAALDDLMRADLSLFVGKPPGELH